MLKLMGETRNWQIPRWLLAALGTILVMAFLKFSTGWSYSSMAGPRPHFGPIILGAGLHVSLFLYLGSSNAWNPEI